MALLATKREPTRPATRDPESRMLSIRDELDHLFINLIDFVHKPRQAERMQSKHICTSLLVFMFLVGFSSISLSQEDNFEGRVKITGTHEGSAHVVEYYLKGDKIRIDVKKPHKAVMISDEKDVIILMPQDKRYMEFSKTQIEQMRRMMGGVQKPGSEAVIDEDMRLVKTGKTKEILGRECVQWIYEDDDKKVETWTASGFGTFMGFKSPMQGGNADAWKGLFGEPDLFPMEMTQWDNNGNQTYKFKVTEIEEKSLSDDLFLPPADYEKIDMMGMTRGIGAQP